MTKDYAELEAISYTAQDVRNCVYSQWSENFAENLVETKVIRPLPKPFLDYLSSESIKLAPESDVIVNSDNEYSDWEGESDETDPTNEFKHLHHQITQNIRRLGGAVAPKLNWSAPKDSTWIMASNTMKCQSANDVYLMLNSSDHITHDLDFPFEGAEDDTNSVDYELVLRKWIEINPALEFRVFVREGKIVGKCQRDTNYYEYLKSLVEENNLGDKIDEFVTKVIEKFNNSNFIIDIYIPRPFTKVYIIDINVFSRVSDSLLYTWPELITEINHDLRLITSHNMATFKTKQYSENQVPIDVVKASNDPMALAELAKMWHNQQQHDEDE